MAEGMFKVGDFPALMSERDYKPLHLTEFDCAAFYGLEGNTPKLFRDFAAHSAAVYIDLGYWGRREGGRWAGYHKVCVNSRHPNAYYRAIQHSPDRLERFHVEPKPWRRLPQGRILLAGMGDKGAFAEGLRPEEWERWAIAELRKYTPRTIVYRPKPSWKLAKPIPGTLYSAPAHDVALEIENAWAVVTHHSNVAVEALIAGVPAFCWGGVAFEMSLQDLARIESPLYPDGRAQWMADIAYTQWSIAEMKLGLPWLHLKKEGLIP